METLFEDLYTLERDKVYLATHCLERTAKVWWKRIKRNRASDLPPLTWEEFRGLFYVNYFPDSEKKKLQEQFRKLKQGSRTVAEYEREALWAEQENAHIRKEREAFENDGGKKRGQSSSGAQAKSRKPPKYPRTQSKGRGPQWCTICGGNHEPRTCDQREGKCFTCGQAGHISRHCPMRASPAPSVASAPTTPAHYGGVPPAVSSAGRAMVPRQPEATRSAPSRRVFAAQTQAEEPAEAEDRHVLAVRLGDWIMPIRMLVFKKLKDFDVILGMDWLSKYYATIHCRSKVITFREPGQEEFTYRDCRSSRFAAMVSATRARKLINSGCTAYLATVVEAERTTPALEELSVPIRLGAPFNLYMDLGVLVLGRAERLVVSVSGRVPVRARGTVGQIVVISGRGVQMD
ncbi:uncharacterized protein LOC109724208 [Ananas comosus]|uniref:Uncharacterized protein LOC109724208 n=1 Tax=Ananas comosus TaxID=4615 RepID=A0A6P5GRH7_ANACO|nr:uncharacterized protein LOC109724208 [Ananas comosus]